MNFIPAAAHHSCLSLPVAFMQPGQSLLAGPVDYHFELIHPGVKIKGEEEDEDEDGDNIDKEKAQGGGEAEVLPSSRQELETEGEEGEEGEAEGEGEEPQQPEEGEGEKPPGETFKEPYFNDVCLPMFLDYVPNFCPHDGLKSVHQV